MTKRQLRQWHRERWMNGCDVSDDDDNDELHEVDHEEGLIEQESVLRSPKISRVLSGVRL